jgi:hypothetical protein
LDEFEDYPELRASKAEGNGSGTVELLRDMVCFHVWLVSLMVYAQNFGK